MAAKNLPVYMLDASLVRSGEVPSANWSGGGNKAGSNACGIGIATGQDNPKAQDWPRIADTAAHNSQHIGKAADVLQAVSGSDVNDTLAFVAVDVGGAANNAEMDAATNAVNLTGGALVQGDWAWGTIPVA